MIYFNPDQNQFEFYQIEATFNHNGNNRHNFHHSKEYFLDFAAKHSGVDNLSIRSVAPTTEQENRLDELNTLSEIEDFHSDARDFVEKGIVNPEGPLASLYTAHETETITFLQNALSDEIRNIRKVKESEGTTFTYNSNTLSVRTDPVTQSKIAAAERMLNKDSTITYIDWERQPLEWSQVDLPMLDVMSKAIFDHVQNVFTESKSQLEQISACNVYDDFKTLTLNWLDPLEVYPLSKWLYEEPTDAV